MAFYNTKYYVKNILNTLGGLPEECSWLDYKESCEFSKKFMNKINKLVVAFLNSIQAFEQNKYIIFGISEDKKEKKKKILGLGEYIFPDDNEWQNLFSNIKPSHPYIETGTIEYRGLLLGYICIFSQNYKGPYFIEGDKDIYSIRRGGNKYEITKVETTELNNKINELIQKDRIYLKTDILNLLVTLGKYNSNNQFDIDFIENRTGKTYDEIKEHCLKIDNLFTQDEKSIYGLENSVTVIVQEKHKRLLQFTSDEILSALEIIKSLLSNQTVAYSHELFEGIADTLIFFENHGFSFYVRQVIESVINLDMFQESRYPIFSQIAEVAPHFMLNLIKENKIKVLEHRRCKANAIQALRTIVWYPEYYEEATKLLIDFNDEAVYELFECGEIASVASFEQKLKLIKELAENDRNLAFDILNQLLDFNPKMNRFINHTYVPEKYKRFRKGTRSLEFEQLQIYYGILVNIAEGDSKKLLKLLPDWLKPYPFSNLQCLADCIDKAESVIVSIDERMELWNRLCNTPLVYITDDPVEDALRNRLISVGNKFKPDSIVQQNKQWFRKNIQYDLTIDGSDWDNVNKKIFEEQTKILLEIYKRDGVKKLIEFVQSVSIEPFRLANILLSPDFSFTVEEEKFLVLAFLSNPEKYASYFSNKSYSSQIGWIRNLNIDKLDINDKVKFFAILNPSIDNIRYFEEILGEDIKLYWEKVDDNIFSNTFSIQYGFEKFIEYQLPQKAFNLLNSILIKQMGQVDPNWFFYALIKQEEYTDCYLSQSAYETIYSILYDKIDDTMLERIEHLSFRLYGRIPYYTQGYDGLKPVITFKKIANDAMFFVKVVKRISDNPIGLWKHIMINCDQEPNLPANWVDSINSLMNTETEEIKKKGEYWIGYILYNTVETDLNGEYKISDCVAGLLEKSEDKRDGFCFHAYYSLNGLHVNGSFKYDAKDRKSADSYKKLADAQKIKENNEFSKILYELADKLIKSVEM